MQKVKNWSPVWIFPIVTALIGAWILFYHYSHQGPEVTLITTNAEGIEGENPDQEPQRRRWGGGERNADRRSHPRGNQSPPQFRDAEAAAQRFRLLGGKAAGWARGISGLGTLLSGAYIELQPGTKGSVPAQYPLLDSPPLASPDAKGSVFCWKAARRASCRRAIRCCSAAIAWGQWKPAPSTRRNVV